MATLPAPPSSVIDWRSGSPGPARPGPRPQRPDTGTATTGAPWSGRRIRAAGIVERNALAAMKRRKLALLLFAALTLVGCDLDNIDGGDSPPLPAAPSVPEVSHPLVPWRCDVWVTDEPGRLHAPNGRAAFIFTFAQQCETDHKYTVAYVSLVVYHWDGSGRVVGRARDEAHLHGFDNLETNSFGGTVDVGYENRTSVFHDNGMGWKASWVACADENMWSEKKQWSHPYYPAGDCTFPPYPE